MIAGQAGINLTREADLGNIENLANFNSSPSSTVRSLTPEQEASDIADAEDAADAADAFDAVGAGLSVFVAVFVLAAIQAAVMEGINVFTAAALPGQIASLISSAATSAPSVASQTSTSSGKATLYSLFVGATLPTPVDQTCNNLAPDSTGLTFADPNLTSSSGAGVLGEPPTADCLNPPPIPPASPTNPQFVVQEKGGTASATTSSITWHDAAAGTTTTARLSGNWFVLNESSQALAIKYTDWDGNEQLAWLLGDPTNGYQFIGYDQTATGSHAPDPSTCFTDGTCWGSSSIDYVGSDGNDYSAEIQVPGTGPATTLGTVSGDNPTGTPMFFGYGAGHGPAEGADTQFVANTFGPLAAFNANNPGGLPDAMTYTWQFAQIDYCNPGPGCLTGLPVNGAALCGLTGSSCAPDYGAPITGAIIDYTFPTSGTYAVQLSATDDVNNDQAVDDFTVTVPDTPPTLAITPGTTTVPLGAGTSLAGTVAHAGSQDVEDVYVDWGDGAVDSGECGVDFFAGPGGEGAGGCFPGFIDVPGAYDQTNIGALTLAPNASNTQIALSDTHTYASAGTYFATVTVVDQSGATVSQRVVETVTNPAPTLTSYGLSSAVTPTSALIGSSPTITVRGFGFVPGSTVDWDGTPLPTTFVSSGGLDVVPGTLTAQVPATDTASAAVATVTVVNAGPGGGTSNPVDFTVVAPPLTVTASSASITYGAAVPAITPSYSGFVSGDSASSLTTPATCTGAPSSGAAGTYQTTCMGAVDPNYTISYVPGTLTIAPASLSITANNATMVYGGPVPAFGATFSGLVNGDASTVVSGLNCGAVDASNNPVSATTPAGTYTITCSGGTAANYAITYQPGTLTIAKAGTAITLASVPDPSVFGQPVTIAAYVAVPGPGAGDPSGTVAFQDGGTTIAGCGAQPVSTATETATCTTSSLGVASHSITATYGGDGNFNGSSTAAPLSQPVSKSASTITLGPRARHPGPGGHVHGRGGGRGAGGGDAHGHGHLLQRHHHPGHPPAERLQRHGPGHVQHEQPQCGRPHGHGQLRGRR